MITKTNEIISQAAQMSRKRGRIVLVGVIGLNISRADFFEKELSFQVSCSYGPGRYDYDYEFMIMIMYSFKKGAAASEGGHDRRS